MTLQEFASHRAEQPSVDRALAALRSRLSTVDLQAVEADLGFTIGEVMAFYRETMGRRYPLPTADGRQFLLSLAEALPLSEVGRFLLCAQGCDWRTTDLFFDEAHRSGLVGQGRDGALPLFDHLLFFVFPGWVATHERFGIFQQQTQPLVKDGAVLASLPCGRMRDLLTLDYTRLRQPVRLVGIDKDRAALAGAQALARELLPGDGLVTVDCYEGDALLPGLTRPAVVAAFDLLTSNGLNIYFTDEQCLAFYANVHAALKSGGVFVTSHLVPPAEYRWEQITRGHVQMQALVWKTLIHPRWESFLKPLESVGAQLEASGFRDVRVCPDSRGVFPTLVAVKPRVAPGG